MAYFQKLAEAQFKRTDDGKWIYFPHGVLARGRLIETTEEKDRILASVKRESQIGIPASILGGLVVGIAGATLEQLVALALVLSMLWIPHWQRYRHLPVTTVRMRYGESVAVSSQALPAWYYGMLGLLSAALLMLVPFAPLIFERPARELAGLILLAGGIGVAGLAASIMLYRARRNAETGGAGS